MSNIFDDFDLDLYKPLMPTLLVVTDDESFIPFSGTTACSKDTEGSGSKCGC